MKNNKNLLELGDVNKTEEETRTYPNKVQRKLYEEEIAQQKGEIERLSNRNDKLAEILKEREQDVTLKDNETASKIVELNRQLDVKLKKICNSKNATNTLSSQRMKEKEDHIVKMNNMKKMHDAVKLKFETNLNILRNDSDGEINALEDFRDKEAGLRQKLETVENLIRKKDEELKRKLNQLDVKLKVDREKLIEDLRIKLFELSKSWESDSKKRRNIFVQKLVNENLCINYELDYLQIQKHDENNYLSRIKNLKFRNERNQHHINKSLVTVDVQKRLINELVKRINLTEKRRGTITPISEEILTTYDCRIDKLQAKVRQHERQLAELMLFLNRKNMELESARSLKREREIKIKKFVDNIYDVKYAISCALKILDTDSNILLMTKAQYIIHLNNLIRY